MSRAWKEVICDVSLPQSLAYADSSLTGERQTVLPKFRNLESAWGRSRVCKDRGSHETEVFIFVRAQIVEQIRYLHSLKQVKPCEALRCGHVDLNENFSRRETCILYKHHRHQELRRLGIL